MGVVGAHATDVGMVQDQPRLGIGAEPVAGARPGEGDIAHDHRDEAREAGEGRAYGPLIGAWAWVVGAGSKAAVVAAKRI